MPPLNFNKQFELDLLTCGDLVVNEEAQSITLYFGAGQYIEYNWTRNEVITPLRTHTMKINRTFADAKALAGYTGMI